MLRDHCSHANNEKELGNLKKHKFLFNSQRAEDVRYPEDPSFQDDKPI